jgi:hypothetical protein
MKQRTKQPSAEIGISRATWYRHRKPERRPVRVTQTHLAEVNKIGVRTISARPRDHITARGLPAPRDSLLAPFGAISSF